MIVVIGLPVLHSGDAGDVAAGPAARIALAAAARGATVQLVGKVGEDAEGEALLLALARGGVGHVALLRDPARRTPVLVEAPADEAAPTDDDVPAAVADRVEPADRALRPALDAGDLDLALRYLTEFRVIVATDALDDASTRVVAEAAGWSNATLIAVVLPGGGEPAGVPSSTIVLEAPDVDPDGTFDRLVGELAAAIDAGTDAREAFRDLVTAAGWEAADA